MFPLPKPSLALSKKWQGIILTKQPFEGFTVVWPALTLESKMTKSCMGPEYTFILRNGEYFKYAYSDKDGMKEIPEKWYSKCFQNITEIPQENMITININGVYIEVPFLPTTLFERKSSTKRRKKTHNIIHTVTYPTKKIPIKVCRCMCGTRVVHPKCFMPITCPVCNIKMSQTTRTEAIQRL